MAKSESNSTQSFLDKGVKTPNVLEITMEKIEAALRIEETDHHHRETHGNRNNIDEDTPLNDVKAPNLFERAKEEIEAVVETIRHKNESQTNGTRDQSNRAVSKTEGSEEEVKGPNLIERTKEKIEAIRHNHHKETHGMRVDIDESTPIGDVKAPNVFERAKEEFEALVEAIHPKKESSQSLPSYNEEEKEFWSSLGEWLENVCCCTHSKRD